MDFAEYTFEAVSRLESVLKDNEKECQLEIDNPRAQPDLKYVRRSLDYIESEFPGVVTSVSRAFTPELKALGTNKVDLMKRVQSCGPLSARVEKLYGQAMRQ